MNIAKRLSTYALRRRVVASTSELGGGSTRPSVWWRGNSYVAASEPSDLPKKRKRIPLEERKAMVASYVNEYRAKNLGKSPPHTEVWRQVGGNYYIVKKIIQELNYKAKMDTMSTVKTYGQCEAIKDGKRLSGTHQLSTSNTTAYKNIHQDGQIRDKNVSSKEAATLSPVQLPLVVTVQEEKTIESDTQTSPQSESAKNNEYLHEVEEIQSFQSESGAKVAESSFESVTSNVGSGLPKETKTEVKEVPFFQADSVVKIEENSSESAPSGVGSDLSKATNSQFIGTDLSEKMETSSSTAEAADLRKDFPKADAHARMQDSPEFDKLKREQAEQPQKSETVTRDLSKHHAGDAEVEKKSNVWDNLKSFADGIISFFRK